MPTSACACASIAASMLTRPSGGRTCRPAVSLEDYPGVLPRLQQVWPRPLDAMAELEALLFRKSRGELFELPAYREVLFLYALARDLLDREGVDPQQRRPAPAAGRWRRIQQHGAFAAGWHGAPMAASGRRDPDDRPTAPVDLDLTQAAPTTSIFDPQDMSCSRAAPVGGHGGRGPRGDQRRCRRCSAASSVSSRLAKHSRARPCSKPPS